MKKVITALSNKIVNDKLKEYEDIQIIMNDIQYQDGILEALEINTEIDYIILSELLPGENTIKELIDKIRKIKNEIKIIIILEKENKQLENYLFSKGNINIFYNNEIKIKEIAELIINKNQQENLEKEIQELKKIIFNKEENNYEVNYKENNKNFEGSSNKNKLIEEDEKEIIITQKEKMKIEQEIEKEYTENLIKNKIKYKFINLFKKEQAKEDAKIFIVTGVAGVGKSIFAINLAKALQEYSERILIIDLDFINNSIQTLFGIKNKEKNNKNNENDFYKEFYNTEISKMKLEDLIIKVNSKINLISKINILISNDQSPNNEIEILKIIKEIKLKYDLIIIDTQNNYTNNYLQPIINETEKIIFITEANLLQIKKSKNLLEKYINEWKIEKEKIHIIFNKIKSDTICFDILKEVFKNYNIIGQVNFIKNCNTLIDQNMKEIFLEKEIKKQYKKIAKNMLKNNKLKKYYLNKIKQQNNN